MKTAIALALALGLLAGCQNKPFEKAGRWVDKTADKVVDKVK